jgi:phage recombination protein Bet
MAVTPLVRVDEKTDVVPFNEEQKALIKDTIAKDQGLTDDEFRLFIYTAQRLGLDPLARQIHAVKRKGRMTIQTGIDGYRAIADRTGKYAGNDDPTYEGVVAEDWGQRPGVARVAVYKIVAGERCAFTSSARWEEYSLAGNEGFMWRKMPFLMLAKCAEALALRKAFPAELSGVYTDEEMHQADRPPPKPTYTDNDGVVRKSGTAIKDLPQGYLEWAIAKGRTFGDDTEAWQEAFRLELEHRREEDTDEGTAEEPDEDVS